MKDTKILQEYFNSLTWEQRKDVMTFMQNVLLAININKDEDFRTEAFNSLFKKYPELQDLFDKVL